MTTRTYLDQCLKDGLLVRWPAKAMPIRVYMAPFRWYEKSKQMESTAYNRMVLEAMDKWSQISGGAVRFQLVSTLNDSQIDINWRRVDRTSLGHCEYIINKQSLIYSAEIRIGISDGLIHAKYNDFDEVRHTVLHEFGHALGLIGHSDHSDDIMYVPHQYGVTRISERDVETLRWLYKLPAGFDYREAGRLYKLPEPFTLHDVIDRMAGVTSKPKRPDAEPAKPSYQENPTALLEHHDILSEMNKFNLSIQNIRLDPQRKQSFVRRKLNPDDPRS